MNDMSKSSFYVVYDGPALESNQMDVRDLAPALLALGDVLEEANYVINGDHAKVSLNVRASFKTGCFGIEFDVVQGMLSHALDFFRHSAVADAQELLGYLGFVYMSGHTSYKGLMGVIKWLRGRQVDRVVLLDNGRVKIIADSDSLEIEQRVLELYRQYRLRQALDRAINQPLKRDGINSFAVSESPESDHFTDVQKNEAIWYATPEIGEEVIADQEEVTNLQLVSIAFREENKWRVSDGSGSFYASISDTNFLDRIQHNEVSFSKGDILKVRLRKRQWIVGEDMKSEYDILEVIEHRRAAAQLQLKMDDSRGHDA